MNFILDDQICTNLLSFQRNKVFSHMWYGTFPNYNLFCSFSSSPRDARFSSKTRPYIAQLWDQIMLDRLVGIPDLLDVKLHDKDNSESFRFSSVTNSGLLLFPIESDPSSFF